MRFPSRISVLQALWQHSLLCLSWVSYSLSVMGLNWMPASTVYTELRLMAREITEAADCVQAYEEMQNHGHRPDVGVYNILVDVLARLGSQPAFIKSIQLFQTAVRQGQFRWGLDPLYIRSSFQAICTASCLSHVQKPSIMKTSRTGTCGGHRGTISKLGIKALGIV